MRAQRVQTDVFLVSKEPWWYKPPLADSQTDSYKWGYLYIFSDGTFVFRANEVPPQDEIESCGSYLALKLGLQAQDQSPEAAW